MSESNRGSSIESQTGDLPNQVYDEPQLQEVQPWRQIEIQLKDSKSTINAMLSSHHLDDSLLIGMLTFLQSRSSTFIIEEFKSSVNGDGKSSSSIQLAQDDNKRLSANDVIDRIWMDVHHPVIKGFQHQFHHISKHSSSSPTQTPPRSANNYNKNNSLNNNNNRKSSSIENRKLFDKFVKFISKSYKFYFDLVEELINTFDLSSFIAVKKLVNTLKIEVKETGRDKVQLSDLKSVAQIVYFIHKCTLYIGDLSRYRTFIAKNYLPTNSISKEDNNNYSKSIELYKLSLLILPSLGDPYNHVAIIDNFKDDRFNVVYNFMRSSLTSKPLPIGLSNLITSLLKGVDEETGHKNSGLMRNFEKYNALDRSTITKIEKFELLKSQFLCLFAYNLLPKYWKVKEGYLPRYYSVKKVEADHFKLISQLDFHKQIFNDFYFKKLVVLIGGFELLMDSSIKHPFLDHDKTILSNYLKSIFRFLLNVLNISLNSFNESNIKDSNLSILLLPLLRLMLCWFNERKLALGYVSQTYNFCATLATILNNLTQYLELNKLEISQKYNPDFKDSEKILAAIDVKPIRQRLFKEDVMMREFQPIGHRFKDFNDDQHYQNNEESIMALIGELSPNSSSPVDQDTQKDIKFSENLDRLLAVCYMGKKLILENNKVGITFNSSTGLFEGLEKFAKSRATLLENEAIPVIPTSENGDSGEIGLGNGTNSNKNGVSSGKSATAKPNNKQLQQQQQSTKKSLDRREFKQNQRNKPIDNAPNVKGKKLATRPLDLPTPGESNTIKPDANFANMIANMVDSLVDEDSHSSPNNGNGNMNSIPGMNNPFQLNNTANASGANNSRNNSIWQQPTLSDTNGLAWRDSVSSQSSNNQPPSSASPNEPQLQQQQSQQQQQPMNGFYNYASNGQQQPGFQNVYSFGQANSFNTPNQSISNGTNQSQGGVTYPFYQNPLNNYLNPNLFLQNNNTNAVSALPSGSSGSGLATNRMNYFNNGGNTFAPDPNNPQQQNMNLMSSVSVSNPLTGSWNSHQQQQQVPQDLQFQAMQSFMNQQQQQNANNFVGINPNGDGGDATRNNINAQW